MALSQDLIGCSQTGFKKTRITNMLILVDSVNEGERISSWLTVYNVIYSRQKTSEQEVYLSTNYFAGIYLFL